MTGLRLLVFVVPGPLLGSLAAMLSGRDRPFSVALAALAGELLMLLITRVWPDDTAERILREEERGLVVFFEQPASAIDLGVAMLVLVAFALVIAAAVLAVYHLTRGLAHP